MFIVYSMRVPFPRQLPLTPHSSACIVRIQAASDPQRARCSAAADQPPPTTPAMTPQLPWPSLAACIMVLRTIQRWCLTSLSAIRFEGSLTSSRPIRSRASSETYCSQQENGTVVYANKQAARYEQIATPSREGTNRGELEVNARDPAVGLRVALGLERRRAHQELIHEHAEAPQVDIRVVVTPLFAMKSQSVKNQKQ